MLQRCLNADQVVVGVEAYMQTLRTCPEWVVIFLLLNAHGPRLSAQSNSEISHKYVFSFLPTEYITHTNLGLNRSVLGSIVKVTYPSTNVHVRLIDRQGNAAGSKLYPVQPNR